MVILSTCNRVEIYAVATQPIFNTLKTFLAEVQGVPVSSFAQALYRLLDQDVIKHLLRVVAGLDSVVLGEPQILGQVTKAYSAARKHGTAGKILSRLFQTTIHAGKRVRTETTIGHNPSSIASVAVTLISEIVPDLSGAEILVLGAGEMAEGAVEALRKRGANRITVVNRTVERARSLAHRWNGRAAALETLIDLLPLTDVVITSTGAPHTIVSPSMVEKVMQNRPDRPLVFMDIAVPRDVEEMVAEIPGVRLFDIDTLSNHLEVALALREAEVPKVEAVLAEEQAGFMEYMASLDVVPIISEMRKQANTIRQAELEKAIRRMPNLPPEAQQHIDELTKSIVKKILHSPTVRLRKEAGGPNAADYANIARGLFELD